MRFILLVLLVKMFTSTHTHTYFLQLGHILYLLLRKLSSTLSLLVIFWNYHLEINDKCLTFPTPRGVKAGPDLFARVFLWVGFYGATVGVEDSY